MKFHFRWGTKPRKSEIGRLGKILMSKQELLFRGKHVSELFLVPSPSKRMNFSLEYPYTENWVEIEMMHSSRLRCFDTWWNIVSCVLYSFAISLEFSEKLKAKVYAKRSGIKTTIIAAFSFVFSLWIVIFSLRSYISCIILICSSSWFLSLVSNSSFPVTPSFMNVKLCST